MFFVWILTAFGTRSQKYLLDINNGFVIFHGCPYIANVTMSIA